MFSTSDVPLDDLVLAARVLASHGLVSAFGHVSIRDRNAGVMRITPPQPLGRLPWDTAPITVTLGSRPKLQGAPPEAWLHWAIYRARSDVDAVCRAQPPNVTALASVGRAPRPLHVLGALVGRVAHHPDARLARDADAGQRIAASLGDADAVALVGNGAVTTGRSAGEAVATMSALESSAELDITACAAGDPRPIPDDQRLALYGLRDELLPRHWRYLAAGVADLR